LRVQSSPANLSAAARFYESGVAHTANGENDAALDDIRRALKPGPNRFHA
jgi:hypothetical protein